MTPSSGPTLVVSLVMAKPKPWIQAACICERALHEPDNVLSIIRMVDLLTLKQVTLPSAAIVKDATQPKSLVQVMDLAIVVTLKSGDLTGDYRISIVMRDPSNNKVTILQESPVVLRGDDGVNVVFRFGLPYNSPIGRYWFDVIRE